MHYAEISLTDLRDLLAEAECAEPHPDLVASTTPSAADIVTVALRNGWYPDPPFFRPAVPVRSEE